MLCPIPGPLDTKKLRKIAEQLPTDYTDLAIELDVEHFRIQAVKQGNETPVHKCLTLLEVSVDVPTELSLPPKKLQW